MSHLAPFVACPLSVGENNSSRDLPVFMKEGRWVTFPFFVMVQLSACESNIVEFSDILNEMLCDVDDFYWKA